MRIIFRPRSDDLRSTFYSRSVPDAPVVANVLQGRKDSSRAAQQVSSSTVHHRTAYAPPRIQACFCIEVFLSLVAVAAVD